MLAGAPHPAARVLSVGDPREREGEGDPHPGVNRLLYAPTTRGELLRLGKGPASGPRAGQALSPVAPAPELGRYWQGEDLGEPLPTRLKAVARLGKLTLALARNKVVSQARRMLKDPAVIPSIRPRLERVVEQLRGPDHNAS